jgi:NADH-quinone oxidoreductase subunit N
MQQFVNLQDIAVFGAEIFVLVLAVMLFVLDWVLPKESERMVPAMAALGSLTALVIAFTLRLVDMPCQIFSLGAEPGSYVGFGGLLVADGYSQFFKVVFLLACFVAILVSMDYLPESGVRSREYYPFLLISTLGMMVAVSARELITLWMALETAVLPVYVLAGYFKKERRSNEAAFKYFVLAAFSSAIFVYGVSILYGLTGTTQIQGISLALSGGAAADFGPLFAVALIFLVAALGFELTLVPFHAWAPDTYEGAPTPVTGFLAVAPKVAALALMGRIFVQGLSPAAPMWQGTLAVLAVLTMTLGNLAAVRQSSAKRMLAYSSIAHAGYMMLGIVAGTPYGLAAAMFYGFVYLFMNMGAFYMLLLLRRRGEACENVADFAGLSRRAPWAAFAMLIFLLSLTGIPVTSGFIGKFWLFGAAIGKAWIVLVVIAALNTVVSLYYYMAIAVQMYFREPDEEVSFSSSGALRLALAVAFAGTFLLALWPGPFWNWAQNCAVLFR